MSSELLNRSAEHLCSNLSRYARQNQETNIWRDYGRRPDCHVGDLRHIVKPQMSLYIKQCQCFLLKICVRACRGGTCD